MNALYHEFVEKGVDEKLGYRSPADMIELYPQFYWSRVEKYIGDALRHLKMTMEGKQWTATLYSHIFAIEHNRRRTGPQVGAAPEGAVPLRVTGEIADARQAQGARTSADHG